MKASIHLTFAATILALTGCASPVVKEVQSSPELVMLAKAAEDAARSQQLLARMTVVNSGDKAMKELKASLAAKPSDDLNKLYSTEYVGVPHGIVKDIAETIGWRFEERGSPDVDSIVRIKSVAQPAIAVLRSVGDQFPFVLAVDEKSKSIVLDYTRTIEDIRDRRSTHASTKPLIQKYAMDGGVFASKGLAVKVAKGYKNKGFDSQIKPVGHKFQIQIGPFVDDGTGERNVRDVLGLHQRVE